MGSVKSENSDVAVIGGGASGLAAALTAAEGGARVVLLEKRHHMGGSSNFAEGMFAVESEMQRPMYMNYSRGQAFRNVMEYNHWKANPRLVRAFIDESAATISWLQSRGVEFTEAITNIPDGWRTLHCLKGPFGAMGAPMIKTLTRRCKEKGVDIRPATPVTKIIREGGRITGVIAETDGEEIQVQCKAVIIGSGGYANNKEWVKKYAGFDIGVNILPMGNTDTLIYP